MKKSIRKYCIGKKSSKRIYSVTLSVNVVNQFNKKVGFGNRSKTIEKLILQDLKNSKAPLEPTNRKRDRDLKGGLDTV